MDAGDELSTAAELRRLSPDIPDAVPLDLLDLARQENTRLIERLERLTGALSALGERATAAREAMASVDSRLDHIERHLGIQKP